MLSLFTQGHFKGQMKTVLAFVTKLLRTFSTISIKEASKWETFVIQPQDNFYPQGTGYQNRKRYCFGYQEVQPHWILNCHSYVNPCNHCTVLLKVSYPISKERYFCSLSTLNFLSRSVWTRIHLWWAEWGASRKPLATSPRVPQLQRDVWQSCLATSFLPMPFPVPLQSAGPRGTRW